MSKYLSITGLVCCVAASASLVGVTVAARGTDPSPTAASSTPTEIDRDDIKARMTLADASSRTYEREAVRIADDKQEIRQINERIRERREARQARREARAAERAAAAQEAAEEAAAEEQEVSSSSAGTAVLTGVWRDLAMCESGLNLRAYNPEGPWMGLFQFAQSTWESVGGTGDPRDASAEEQLKRAMILQSRSGWGPWPSCASQLGLL